MGDEWLDQMVLEIQGGKSDKAGRFMKYVFDRESGRYLAPTHSPQQLLFEEQLVKSAFRLTFLKQEGATEESFEAAWPEMWKQYGAKSDEPAAELYAVVDTGLLPDHPLLTNTIIDGVNYSTEDDMVDHNGHGTMIALLYIAALNSRARFLNLKVANAYGEARPKDLIRALRWLIDYRQSHPNQELAANLSIGTYSKSWLGFACKGTCSLCMAALEAAEAGIRVVAAAGNQAGKTTCPATAAVYDRHENIWAVSQLGWEHSGIGTAAFPGGATWGLLEEQQESGQ